MRLDAFGRRLRAFRKLKQMTQVDLARAIGVSVATIGSIERGTRQPTADLVGAIASALSIDAEELYGPAARADDSADDAIAEGSGDPLSAADGPHPPKGPGTILR